MADDLPIETSYDAVPYRSNPYPQTHPDRLATVAALFGLSAPPVEQASILELGCASGGNIIPLGAALPETRIVGIDLSSRQISDGLEAVHDLGLTNVELRHASILEVDESWGRFDYVICHGVFSWVPEEVRSKILDICAANLTSNGVAFVSYNTYPGWHLRGMVREMMRYHAARFTDPATQVNQVLALLDFVASSAAAKDAAYARVLAEERELLRSVPGSYVFHEHLEDANVPLYFHQFVELASQRDLQYLGEANVSTMAATRFSPETQRILRGLSADLVQAEQYMDFLRNRTMRTTLLCHDHQVLDRSLDPSRIEGMQVASSAKRAGVAGADGSVEFRASASDAVRVRDTLLVAALDILAERWPATLAFGSLLDGARVRADHDDAATYGADARSLAAHLLRLHLSTSRFVELRTTIAPFTIDVSPQPVALAVARLQASTARNVTNARHEIVKLGEPERQVIQLLDGTRGRDALAESVARLLDDGVLASTHDTGPDHDSGALARRAVDQVLGRLARAALLVG